jgi:RHS repeat-associated protein
LATGSWTRVATTTAETKGETSYILYDNKYRPIRSYSSNYLGGYTCTDSKLDSFSGQLQYTVQKHKRTAADTELTVKEAFTYSAQDRLLTHTHQINGGTVQLLAENTYDELGQLVSKKVGNTSATPLQKVDYTYNIRGWMKSINNPSALQQGSDPADLFGFKINYNTVDGSATSANKLYNGNIAETFWSTATDGGFVRNYGYKYDQLNRLKDATYQKSNVVTNMYNENLTYDKNGNIMTLKRNGDNDTQAGTIGIDNLTYAYATNSNKLMRVTEAQPTATSGFKDGNTTGDDYVYDANGNMTVDKNKNITSIVYNHLNLPTKIVFATGNIVYIYNAAGQKVQKVVTTTTPASVVTTDYLGGYQYKNTVLQYFPTAEGYVKNTPVSGTNTYSYVFNYTDHLGNTRLSYTKDSATGSLKILEESNYYPFGLKHNGYNPISPVPENRRLFNGKELQEELGLNQYDYGSRMYDPARAGWSNIDPLTEKMRRWSPYNYCFNNPIRFTDPDGMAPTDVTILIAKDGAGGQGHMASVIQDGKGNFYYVTLGAAENAGLSKMSSGGVQGGMSVQKIEGAKTMADAVKIAKSDTNNSKYTDQVTFKTNSKTDQAIYEKTTEKAKGINSGAEKYNLLTNNCTDGVERPIEKATGVSLPDAAKPNSNFDDLKSNKEKIQNEITATEKKIEKVELKDEKKLAESVKDVTNIQIR